MYYVTFGLGLGSTMYYDGTMTKGFPTMRFDWKKAAKLTYEEAGRIANLIQTTNPEAVKISKA